MPEAHNEVTIDFTAEAGTQTEASIERGLSATGPWVMLEENVALLGEIAVYIDSTAPLDIPVWYRATGTPGPVTEVYGPFTSDSLDMVWLKDPLRPWATVAFDFCDTVSGHNTYCTTPDPEYVWGGFGTETWSADVGRFPILNAEHDADVYARRKHLDGSMVFFTRTLAARDAIYALFTAGGPLFLQAPAIYGWADAYVQPGDVSPEYISRDQRRPERRYEVPFFITDPVTGPAQGTLCANWCAVQDAFATFADMTAAGGTWLDVAQGDLVCP